MELYIYQGITSNHYPISGIQFDIDEMGEPVDIMIKACDDVLDAIEKDFNISSRDDGPEGRCIFVGRMPRFTLE